MLINSLLPFNLISVFISEDLLSATTNSNGSCLIASFYDICGVGPKSS